MQSSYGTIEYATRGSGPPLLVAHGVFGGFDAALDHASRYAGDGFRVVAPSRFGYLGSTMPAGASASDQADAFAELLTHLGIDRAAVFGFSAGSVSAIQFALRHPDRTSALILGSGHYPQKHYKIHGNVLRPIYTDLAFWAAKTFFRRRFWGFIAGLPKTYEPSTSDIQTINEVRLLPIGPRREGAIFDTIVSEPEVDHYPLESITVPTLMIHARDDRLAKFETVPPAAVRIPGVRFVVIERGAHLLLGAEARARREIAEFGRTHAAPIIKGVAS